MEQDNLFNSADVRNLNLIGGDVNWWVVTLNYAVSQTRLKMYKCPSDTVEEVTAGGLILYAYAQANTIDAAARNAVGDQDIGRTNYAAVAGAFGTQCIGNAPDPLLLFPPPLWASYEGVMCNRTENTLGQLTVQDGTSNTLMIGEGLGGVGVGPRDFTWAWIGIGGMGTGFGLGRSSLPPNAGGSTWDRFGSRHSAVTQFCFADCSTRGIRFGATWWDAVSIPSADWAFLQQIAGRNDGYNSDTASILD
jgi:hypothetical protein